MAADVSIKELVCDYLGALQKAGQLRLAVDDEARAVLRSWMLAKKHGVAHAAPQTAAPDQAEPQADPALRNMVNEVYSAIEQPAAAPPDEPDDEAAEIFFRPGGNSPQESWQRAAQLIERWEPLQKLNSLRKTLVWGAGSLSAPIMFVADAPGYYDELEQKPLRGESGAKLDAMLKAMDLTRDQVYITHLVKYRPSVPRQTTNNRPPNKEEMRVSLPVLEFELRLVKPRVVVALGVTATRGILQLDDQLPLAACRQIPGASFCGVPVVVTHHPSYLLRTTALAERRSLWEDMLRAMELAQLPITPKQQGYFLPKK